MRVNQSTNRIFVSIIISFALIQQYSLAAPLWEPVKDDSNATRSGSTSSTKAIFGRLAVIGDKTVMINGNGVKSGATVLSGALLETPKEAGASLQLGNLGRLEIAPHSRLQISFTAGQIDISLLSGCTSLTTAVGVKGTVMTVQGRTERIGPTAATSVDVCAGDTDAAIGNGMTGPNGAFGSNGTWSSNAQPPQGINGINPMFLVGAAPFAFTGLYAVHCNGRPPVASPCGCCCL